MLLSHALLRFDLPAIEATRRQELAEPGTARLSLRARAGVWIVPGLDSWVVMSPRRFHSSSHVYHASGSKNGNAPPATLRVHVIVKEFWRPV